jgi:hypothetical protein
MNHNVASIVFHKRVNFQLEIMYSVYFAIQKNNEYVDLSIVIQISKKKIILYHFCVAQKNKTFVIEILYVSAIHHQLLLKFCYIIFLNI